MKLAMIASAGAARSAAVVGDEVIDLGAAEQILPIARWVPSSMKTLIAGGDEGLEIVRRIVGLVENASDALREDLRETGVLSPLAIVRLAAPVPDPGILLSHACAYHAHLAEMGKNETPPRYPVGFMKRQFHRRARRTSPSAAFGSRDGRF